MDQTQPNQSNGTGSLVCGILLLLIPYIGLVFGIIAVFLASRSSRTGLAKGGQITGIIGIIINALMITMLATGVFVLFDMM